MTDVQILGLILIGAVLFSCLGHAAGYARRKDFERRRRAASMKRTVESYGRPRYRRTPDVSRPE